MEDMEVDGLGIATRTRALPRLFSSGLKVFDKTLPVKFSHLQE
jgi:hypothetical protein